MLMLRRTQHLLIALACAAAASLVLVVASPASAADDCDRKEWVGGKYQCVVDGTNPQPPTPPGNGSDPVRNPPTCNLEGLENSGYDNPSAPYCAENKVCITVDLFAPVAMPDGDKPNEDSEARVRVCRGPLGVNEVGEAFWSDDEEPPTLLEQALTAIGQIDLATPAVNVSPAARTLVNLDTWFWVTGTQRETTGSSAFGLVAIATFRSMTVNPGDGSASFTCDWVTSAAQAETECVHEYRKASNRGSTTVGGRPAFTATVNTVYDLRFEVNGEAVQVDGAPATLQGPPGSAAVRVDEAQAIVRPPR